MKLTVFRIRWFICRRLRIRKVLEIDLGRVPWNEPNVIREKVKSCRGVFVDVGAGVGSYAKIAKSAKRIMCFEPDPRCLAKLGELKERLGDRLELFPVALGSRSGLQLFHIAEKILHSSLIQPTSPEKTSRLVIVETLDNYVDRIKDGEEVVVKIDTEGAEHLILEGGYRFIERHKPLLLIEYHNNLREVYKLLRQYNYKLITLVEDRRSTFKHGWLVAKRSSSAVQSKV